MSAKDIACTPLGRFPVWARVNPASLLFTQIWKILFPVRLSSQTIKISRVQSGLSLHYTFSVYEPARQSPLRSTTALLCGFDGVHCVPSNLGSTLWTRIFKDGRQRCREFTYRSNNGEWGWEAFHTFCQTWNGPVLPDGMPRRSILISPVVSSGIGWEKEEGGIVIGFWAECDYW